MTAALAIGSASGSSGGFPVTWPFVAGNQKTALAKDRTPLYFTSMLQRADALETGKLAPPPEKRPSKPLKVS